MILRTPRALFFGICIAVVSVVPVQESDAALSAKGWGNPGRVSGRTAAAPNSGIGVAELQSLSGSWRVDGGEFTPPVVTSALVIAGDNGGNGAVRLRAFRLGDGASRWQRAFGSSSAGSIGPPSTDGNLVFVTVERRIPSGFAQDLFAFHIADGTHAWKAELGTSTRRLGAQEVTVTSGTVLTRTSSGTDYTAVAGYSAATGFWRYSRTPGGAVTAFVASDGRLFVATDTTGASYDLDLGQPLIPISSIAGMKSLAVAGDRLFGSTTTHVSAVSASLGYAVWSVPASEGCEPVLRVITAELVIASQKTCANGPPLVLTRAGANYSAILDDALSGDIPIVFGDHVLIATSTAGRIKAWNLIHGVVYGTKISLPRTREPVMYSRFGGPVVAWDRVIVPEHGALQVFAP